MILRKSSSCHMNMLNNKLLRCIILSERRRLSAKAEENFMPIGFTTLSAESLKLIASPSEREVDQLAHFLDTHRKIVCITGAGISTASGIPDYRGPAGSYRVAQHKPITHQEFLGLASLSPIRPTAHTASQTHTQTHTHAQRHTHGAADGGAATRRRYWARALGGYERVKEAQPNDAHFALHHLLLEDKLSTIVTQNVDGLHHKCFSSSHNNSSGTAIRDDAETLQRRREQDKRIVDLHGRIDRVVCVQCRCLFHRDHIQERLYALNPRLDELYRRTDREEFEKRIRADGDMDLQGMIDYNKIQVPSCERCGDGVLKPDVVFFGDNVKKEIVDEVYENVDDADALLVVGSSLEVFSAFRFVDRAMKRNLPVAIINHGETRADRKAAHQLSFRSHANCAMLLRESVKKMYQ